jgi:hypothetical protein
MCIVVLSLFSNLEPYDTTDLDLEPRSTKTGEKICWTISATRAGNHPNSIMDPDRSGKISLLPCMLTDRACVRTGTVMTDDTTGVGVSESDEG